MSGNSQTAAQPDSSTWTEPPWSGWIETTGDALLILEAARRGLIPRVTRRLVDSERKMITSGSVFVFDEDESGIKRWTDGFFWSPSRILGNFLLYRETDKRGAGHRGSRSDPQPSEVNEQSQYSIEGMKLEGQSLSRPKGECGQIGVDKHRERTLMGSLTNSYKFKPDGLMKKTFSLTIGGVSQHLISYYKIEDVEGGRLRSPSSLPELASLDISPEYLDKTHFRNPPKVEIGVDGVPRYRGESEDGDSSPTLLSGPLSSGLPDPNAAENTASRGKRSKRYGPYAAPTTPKRSRKTKSGQNEAVSSSTEQSASQSIPTAVQTPGHAYPDPNMPAMPHTHYPPYAVPSYYQVPGYPMPPPPHMYSASPYPNTVGPIIGGAAQQPPQGSVQPSQYSYPAYSPPTTAVDPSQAGQNGQQPYYPYYPPPPGHYPGYAGVAWPHYAGYPPQPIPQQQAIASAPEKDPSSMDTEEVEEAESEDTP